MAVFQGARDRYSGVTVTSTAEPCAAEQLEEQLRRSLAAWAADKARSVWFHVAPAEAAWVPVLVNQGFTFHHASPARVALLKWLPEDEPNNVPSYAHTLVGVGGMVVTDDGQLLVVEERFATQPHWKLPGGYVDPGEGLAAAAVREVLEETGVRTEFRSVVAFRHGHDFNFGCSDIFIVVALRPLTTDIKADQKEIAKCRWMPLQEYAGHPLVHATNRHFAAAYQEAEASGARLALTEIELRIKDFVRQQTVYSVQHQDKQN